MRQIGGHGYAIATLVLTGVLIAATIWLQRRNNELQKEHADLQRAFNEMQASYEQKRRDAEERRAEERRQSVEAYATRRTLNGWIFAAQHLRALGEPPRLVLGDQDKALGY